MNTNKPGLTPLDALKLPDALLALCRERQIVTAEQARDLIEMLLQHPDGKAGDTRELNTWLDQLDRLIGVENKPPDQWTPVHHPIGGVLPPDEWRNEHEPEGLRPLHDDESEDHP